MINSLNVHDWREFCLSRICEIDMGNKFDSNKMSRDCPSVNFVSRTGNNNGVSDIVDAINNITPYPAGTLSVALGGSIGSCFCQTRPYYTGQNVCVLSFKEDVSTFVKHFFATLFMNECKHKFVAFGRELNAHINTDFTLLLPIRHNPDGTPFIDSERRYSDEGYVPDWLFMEDFIKTLHCNPITTLRGKKGDTRVRYGQLEGISG